MLHIQKSKLSHLNGSGSGVRFIPTGPAELYITECDIHDNGGNAGTAGVLIQNNSSNLIGVTIANSQINNNFNGVIASTTSSGGIFFNVVDTVVAGNSGNGITMVSGGSAISSMLDNVKVMTNGGYGISPNGANTTTRLMRSVITGNVTGVNAAGGGQFFTFGNNAIEGNFTNGGALTPIQLK